MNNFDKITKDLYRGSAPTSKEVEYLHNKFKINKIISLDQRSGDNIKDITNKLGIEHKIIHLDSTKKSLYKLFENNLKELLLDNGPTFIHCKLGKDRTGLLAAIFKCKYLGVDPEEVLNEAKLFGFGVNIDPKMKNLYTKLILSCKPSKSQDVNELSIVDYTREYKSDPRDSYLNEGFRHTFAPQIHYTRQDPYTDPYHSKHHIIDNMMDFHLNGKEKTMVPEIGTVENNGGIQGGGFNIQKL